MQTNKGAQITDTRVYHGADAQVPTQTPIERNSDLLKQAATARVAMTIQLRKIKKKQKQKKEV